jgi:hypothetical protein
MARALPEGYRQACRIQEGYEVHTADGWVEITHVLRIYAPANFVRLDLADGSAVALNPTEPVLSRRSAVA